MRIRSRLPALLIVLGLLCLPSAGCGDDQTASDPQDPGWSDPAAGKGATGSPDGDSGASQSAAALLGALRDRVRAGRGHTDASFDSDVDSVAAVLWSPDAAGPERAAAQVHMQLAVIAGDVGRALAAKPPQSVDATEKKIHAAWLEAAAGSPDAYRAWCAQQGAALLKEREQALRERFFK